MTAAFYKNIAAAQKHQYVDNIKLIRYAFAADHGGGKLKRNERAFQLISEKESLERKLKDATRELEQIQRTCRHEWGETKYDPVIKEAYTIPGDPPGTMGVDWRGPTHVPRQEKKRWKRVCPVCGLVEYTEKATERITSVPSF